VFLGGTALTGGKGSMIRTIVGVMFIIIIQSGLNVAAVDAF
jgi:ribose transport system permease protein